MSGVIACSTTTGAMATDHETHSAMRRDLHHENAAVDRFNGPDCSGIMLRARDTGLVSITSNDPVVPLLEIRVLGKGFALTAEIIIDNVILVPFMDYLLRIRWFRSVYDSAALSDPVTEYSVWRSVPGTAPWEFITTVPALRFDEYSCLVPAVIDYTRASTNVLKVAARTKNLQVFISLPDTVQVNPGYITGIGGTETSQAVSEFMLSQNYPNPFNPVTRIGYRVPGEKNGSGVLGLGSSWVKLAVYDLLGREVAVLVNEKREAGNYSVQFNGTGLGGGVYFYRIQVRPLDTSVGRDSKNGSGDFVATKKFLLMK